MEYFWIFKTDKKSKSNKKILLKDGYKFNQKVSITLYNYDMISYILKRKINNSLKAIINLYLLYDDEDDSTRISEILPKIELLRNILLENYSKWLDEDEVRGYLSKLDKIEKKLGVDKSKKSRSR